jgi:hypothetical protein
MKARSGSEMRPVPCDEEAAPTEPEALVEGDLPHPGLQ